MKNLFFSQADMRIMAGQLKLTLLLVLVTQINGSKRLGHFIEDIIYKWKLLSPTIILSEDGESLPDICLSGKRVLCLRNDQGRYSVLL